MRARRFAPLAVPLALCAALPFVTRSVADALGTEIGGALARHVGGVDLGCAVAPGEGVAPSTRDEPVGTAAPQAVASGPAAAARPRRRVVPRHGLRVRAPVVLRLASSGAMPGGSFVPATASRPAGIVLTGVGALGVGLLDGDVLTHAAGRPVTSVRQVIGAVVGARARREPAIGGVFWRRGEPWQLVVDQPYVDPKDTPSRIRRVASRAAGRSSRREL